MLCLLLLARAKKISAQYLNYTFQHLTTKDGLASDFERFICQDDKGFYLIGYENGFQKFDGKNFKDFFIKNKYIKSDTSIMLAHPIKDKEGDIFIYYQDRLYNYRTNGIVDTISIQDNVHEKGRNIQAFCKGANGDIWIATKNYLYKYNKSKHTCARWLSIANPKFSGGLSGLIYDDKKKCFWLAKNSEIFMIDIHGKKITEPFLAKNPGLTDIPKGIWFTGFWMDSRRNLWIGTFGGVMYKYNTVTYKKEVFDVFNIKNTYFNRSYPVCFLEDKQNNIWLVCGGLYRYDKQSNTFHLMQANKNIANALNYSNDISALYQDNEGNIWIGTGEGIYIFNPLQQQFNVVDEHTSITDFQKTEVTKIFETNTGNILVATWGKGWWLFNKDFRLKRKFLNDIKKTDKTEQRKNFVWCFGEDPAGKIWIGYQYGLVGTFNPVNHQIRYIDVPEFEKKTIMAIQCDTMGNVWFGLYSGALGKWDALQHKFLVYPSPFDPIKPISDLVLEGNDDVWVSTNGNGFYCFHPLTGKYTDHHFDTGNNSIFDNEIHGLCNLNDSVIGIANAYKGFILFNRKNKTFTSYTNEKGLAKNMVFGIALDKQNNLWIAEDNALSMMNGRNNNIVSFDVEDGLSLKQFRGTIAKLHDGKMAIPAATGFVYFDPEKITHLPAPPDAIITGFSIFDKQLSIDSLLATGKPISLGHTQNFLTITYASISFQQKNSIRYYYQLEGINKHWITAGSGQSASYTDLRPGRYTFKVRAENRDGLFSKKITTLSIYIISPWWATFWAYAIYLSVASSIVYVIFRNRVRKIRQKQQAQINIMIATQEEERKRISRDLHDDVGTKLSALKLFLSSLNEKASNTNNKEIQTLAANSEQFITETIKDVRQLLLNLSPSVLEEFGYTTAVEGLVNKINETKQIQFNLVVFGMQQRLPKHYELALYRITQELINNVLKHAEAKNVSLQIGRRDNKIILMIEDDGKGFDINVHKDGYGLQNLEARTKLLHGMLTIDSRIGIGTSILIEIPDNFN
jgi:signal transduction histidine kinase/ligand-binding sensor domain-containing protein